MTVISTFFSLKHFGKLFSQALLDDIVVGFTLSLIGVVVWGQDVEVKGRGYVALWQIIGHHNYLASAGAGFTTAELARAHPHHLGELGTPGMEHLGRLVEVVILMGFVPFEGTVNENLFTITGIKNIKWFLYFMRCRFQPRVAGNGSG